MFVIILRLLFFKFFTLLIIQLVLHIWQGFLAFSYDFIFDRMVCVLVTFYQWGHFVMTIIRNLNLIGVQPWTYLSHSSLGLAFNSRQFTLRNLWFVVLKAHSHKETFSPFLWFWKSQKHISIFGSWIIMVLFCREVLVKW